MKLVFKILFTILLLFVSFGCRQFFGDRTQTDSIIEPTEVNSILITQPEYGSKASRWNCPIFGWSLEPNNPRKSSRISRLATCSWPLPACILTPSPCSVSSGEVSSVDIILYKKNELIMKIAEAVTNSEEFNWRIPVNLKSSVHYLIYVLNHYNHDEFDISDRFIIQN